MNVENDTTDLPEVEVLLLTELAGFKMGKTAVTAANLSCETFTESGQFRSKLSRVSGKRNERLTPPISQESSVRLSAQKRWNLKVFVIIRAAV